MLQFIVTRDDEDLTRGRIYVGRTTVGRNDDSNIVVREPHVSGTQLILGFDGHRCTVRDAGSANGTLLNGAFLPTDRDVPFALDEAVYFGHRVRGVLAPLPQVERSPVPTLRCAVEVYETLVSAGMDAVESVHSVLLFHRGPRRGEEVPLLTTAAALGGPRPTVDLGPEFRGTAAATVWIDREYVRLQPHGRRCRLGDARLTDEVQVERHHRFQIGPHVFSIDQRQARTVTPEADGLGGMVGASGAMRRVFGLLHRLAPQPLPVLVVGEMGTGKELAAEALHKGSPRANGPFVAVNCATLERNLADSELFGHAKGAFTGAVADKRGAFFAAHGGTLFLDELGELSPEVQAKLLRALELGEVRRVGETVSTRVDVRVVAATNQDLTGIGFRPELLERLAVGVVVLPPLRQRMEDLPILIDALVARFHPGLVVTVAARAMLAEHDWPGNVRELRNVLARGAALAEDGRIRPEHVQFTRDLLAQARGTLVETPAAPLLLPGPPAGPPPVPAGLVTIVPADEGKLELTRDELVALYQECGGEEALAERLGMSRAGVRRYLDKLGIPRVRRGRPRKGSRPPGSE